MASNCAATAINHGRCLPKTSSRCITESVTTTHDFEVADYPLLDGMGVGKPVRSSSFSIGGYEWCIRFFPDGSDKDCDNHASAYLCCLSRGKAVRTKFTLSMLGKGGIVLVKSNLSEHTFSPISDDWGYLKFMEKSKLKSFLDVNNSSFIIRCVVTVIEASRTEVIKRKLIVVPQPNLQEQLEHLRKDGGGADVTFSVSGQVFSAHRCVLAARSPVFKAELFGPMKEKAAKCIKIDDIEPPIFEALLHFMYTDSLLDGKDRKKGKTALELQHLLVAADRYGVERLKVICESKLCESIDVETAATTLVLAEQHHCSDLREACIEFIASRNMLGAVMATDGFKHLVASCPSVMEILGKVCQGYTAMEKVFPAGLGGFLLPGGGE